jgi:hypothetical protein
MMGAGAIVSKTPHHDLHPSISWRNGYCIACHAGLGGVVHAAAAVAGVVAAGRRLRRVC